VSGSVESGVFLSLSVFYTFSRID